MTKIKLVSTLLLLIICSLGGFSQEKEELKNWHLQDFTSEQRGINVEKVYQELLADKSPQATIVVAVIDSGVDINHEDLKELVWVNTDEIPDNNIDDDRNGYVDDVNGWNFLGNANGDMVNNDNLEVSRLYKKYSTKFEGKTEDDLSKNDLDQWNEFQRVKKDFEEGKLKAQKSLQSFQNFKASYDVVMQFFESKLGEDFTKEDALAYKPENEDEAEIQGFYSYISENGVDQEYMESYEEYVSKQADWYYNENVDVRRDIIKDNPNDIYERGYGNGNVIGGDPSHGTHVAGIIGAVRNNGIGMNGIANHIQIMSVRTVPGGDEHDKDVANAIRYAVDNGARVINMSFGKAYSPNEEAVAKAIQYAEDHDVILIHAAGNDSQNLDETNNFPTNQSKYIRGKVKTYLTVGASSIHANEEFVADFSNYGNNNVDIFAPGVDIYSTYPNDEYHFNNGTSMAAPTVSGVAALILSYFPDLKGREVTKIITQTAKELPYEKVYLPGSGGENEEGEEVSKTSVNFEDLSKTDGLLDAFEAIKLADKKSKF